MELEVECSDPKILQNKQIQLLIEDKHNSTKKKQTVSDKSEQFQIVNGLTSQRLTTLSNYNNRGMKEAQNQTDLQSKSILSPEVSSRHNFQTTHSQGSQEFPNKKPKNIGIKVSPKNSNSVRNQIKILSKNIHELQGLSFQPSTMRSNNITINQELLPDFRIKRSKSPKKDRGDRNSLTFRS